MQIHNLGRKKKSYKDINIRVIILTYFVHLFRFVKSNKPKCK